MIEGELRDIIAKAIDDAESNRQIRLPNAVFEYRFYEKDLQSFTTIQLEWPKSHVSCEQLIQEAKSETTMHLERISATNMDVIYEEKICEYVCGEDEMNF